ncbi:hypothetical protein ARMGADRAFT_1091281 [Armillaria gallica]|uniref:Uncharacterized protein n=1 Tax=Armillaria gallica TaxID=47427 RepID=A0A2H3CQ99_ARMGA|nr:hypothetical protein ARMGADRAFT_1091281 [Armillaria gallica]
MEDEGIMLHRIDGELYNNKGGKEVLSAPKAATVTVAPKPTVTATAKKTATGTKTAVMKKVMREAPVKKSSDVRLECVSDTADKSTAGSSTDQACCSTPPPPPPSGSSPPPPPLPPVMGLRLPWQRQHQLGTRLGN